MSRPPGIFARGYCACFKNALGHASRDFGLVLLLLVFATGCGKHPEQPAQKMAVQTDAAKSLESLRAGDNAAYIAMVRAENETDLGFKVGGIVGIIGPAPGSDWNEGSVVKRGFGRLGIRTA